MPRLTNNTYLTTRMDLIELWNERDGATFAVLPICAQHDLHDFYAPSVPMTDSEALAHRAAMAEAFPSLPQSAGRAAAALRDSLEKRPNQILERHPTLDERHLVKVIEALWRQGLNDEGPRSKK